MTKSTIARGPLFTALFASTMLTGAGTAAFAQERATTLDEVVVTAQKREENLQNVPLSIQALGEEKLEQLEVADFADFAKFLPTVSFKPVAPGFTSIYMRGVASGENSNHSGPLPSVGVYLDEAPITTITGPLDLHIYDIARVESLAGPQGTLYGASSQAGTIRIITNKPDVSGFSAGYDIEGNTVDHGGQGYVAEGFINLPVSDNAAIRLVGWAKHDAGYIDNVPGSITYPTPGYTLTNTAAAENDYNIVDTYGARAALRIDLNDNWTITPNVIVQDQRSEGSFAYDPSRGDLKIVHFYPEKSKDRFGQIALTLEGKLSNLDVVYAGAMMRRHIDSESDYTDYSYFYDTLAGYGSYWYDDDGVQLNDFSQYIQAKDRFTKQSHEIRVSTPKDQRLRGVAGFFYQQQRHRIEQRYKIDQLAQALEVPGWADTLWLTKQLRIDRDYAAFGEAEYDFTDKLTGTAGIRVFKARNSLEGFFGFGTGYSSGTGVGACFAEPVVPGSPCTNLIKEVEETGYSHRLNLTYRVTDDKLIYATWSTGFRPGGINRRGTLPPYKSDFLTNYEFGWKTTWLDNRLRFNGAVFFDKWEDFQFSFLGANGLTEIRNANNAEMMGVELEANFRATEGLTLTAAGSYTDAELTEDYCNNAALCPPPDAPAGTELPITPKFKGNLIARYEFAVGDMDAHLQGAVAHQSSSWGDLRLVERAILGKLPAFTTADFTTGLERDNWTFDIYLTNAFDERGELARGTQCAISTCGARPLVVPIQPRTLGVRFGQRF